MMTHTRFPVRIALGALLGLIAANAFFGGVYGMAGAKGVPRVWLEGSPFTTYFVPGLILFAIVGGALAIAAAAVLANVRWARLAAMAAGTITLGWIAVQVAIVGFVSWLQPAVAAASATVLALASRLPAP